MDKRDSICEEKKTTFAVLANTNKFEYFLMLIVSIATVFAGVK